MAGDPRRQGLDPHRREKQSNPSQHETAKTSPERIKRRGRDRLAVPQTLSQAKNVQGRCNYRTVHAWLRSPTSAGSKKGIGLERAVRERERRGCQARGEDEGGASSAFTSASNPGLSRPAAPPSQPPCFPRPRSRTFSSVPSQLQPDPPQTPPSSPPCPARRCGGARKKGGTQPAGTGSDPAGAQTCTHGRCRCSPDPQAPRMLPRSVVILQEAAAQGRGLLSGRPGGMMRRVEGSPVQEGSFEREPKGDLVGKLTKSEQS